MTNMKTKNLLLSLGLGAVAALGVTSCSDYSEWTEGEINMRETLSEYTRNFESRYGTIDPNHDWGFGPIETRSTRGETINKNEWETVYHLQVPGWPDTYYCANDKDVHSNGNHYSNDTYKTGETHPDYAYLEPGGDVTDEEIRYVSWWFRTHRYPTSLKVHWSDFFIQEVSSDNDRDATGHVDKDFTVFQYNEGSQAWDKVIKQYTMTLDYLAVKTLDDVDTYVHLEKFNAGRSNNLYDVEQLSMGNTFNFATDDKGLTTDVRLIDFYSCAGTEDFQVHNSVDNTYRSNYKFQSNEEPTPIWVLVHLHFIGESGRIYDGYYLAFDFAAFKNDGNTIEMREPDGYYSNWIVKISPAVPLVESSNSFTRRIMCEDLGNTLDFDFDDVVFDATLNQKEGVFDATGKADITINLMASGGTMPIWVGKKDDKFEAHTLFNKPTTVPVNVGSVNAPVANYHVTLEGTAGTNINFDDIDIWVYNTRRGEEVKLPKSTHYLNGDGNTNVYNPSRDERFAPQKFAVPASVLWLKETHQIEQGYPKFGAWAHNHTLFPVDQANAWYLTNVDATHLCGQAGKTPYNNDPTPGQSADNGYPGTTSTYWNVKTWDVVPYVNNADWGSVTVSGGVGANQPGAYHMYKAGQTATVTATPTNGATFTGWKDLDGNNIVSTANPYTFVVNKRHNIVAVFSGTTSSQKHQLEIVKGDGVNSVEILWVKNKDNQEISQSADGKYDVNTRIRVRCGTIDSKYKFIGWYLNGSKADTNVEYEFTIDGLTRVEARTAEKLDFNVALKFQDADGNDKEISEMPEAIKLNINNQGDIYTEFSKGYSSATLISCVGEIFYYDLSGVDTDTYDVVWGDGGSHPNTGNFSVGKGMYLEVIIKEKPVVPDPDSSSAKTRISRKK